MSSLLPGCLSQRFKTLISFVINFPLLKSRKKCFKAFYNFPTLLQGEFFVEQNSNEWLEWRRKGLGASDAPVVMGVSPYKTPFQLFEEKIGKPSKKKANEYITNKGHKAEGPARARAEFKIGMVFKPELVEMENYEWLRASLDGYNEEHHVIMEIKYQGAEDHAKAKAWVDGEIKNVRDAVPEKYWPQIQHQLMVTGAKVCYFVSFDGDQDIAIVEVKPDTDYIQQELFPELFTFWERVGRQEAPELTDRDVVEVEEPAALKIARRYARLDALEKKIKFEKDKAKSAISEFITHPKAKVGQLSVTKTIKKGTVDYKQIPQLEGIDLDAYRKSASTSITIRVGKAEAKS